MVLLGAPEIALKVPLNSPDLPGRSRRDFREPYLTQQIRNKQLVLKDGSLSI